MAIARDWATVATHQQGHVRLAGFEEDPKTPFIIPGHGVLDRRAHGENSSPRIEFWLLSQHAEIADAIENIEVSEDRAEHCVD